MAGALAGSCRKSEDSSPTAPGKAAGETENQLRAAAAKGGAAVASAPALAADPGGVAGSSGGQAGAAGEAASPAATQVQPSLVPLDEDSLEAIEAASASAARTKPKARELETRELETREARGEDEAAEPEEEEVEEEAAEPSDEEAKPARKRRASPEERRAMRRERKSRSERRRSGRRESQRARSSRRERRPLQIEEAAPATAAGEDGTLPGGAGSPPSETSTEARSRAVSRHLAAPRALPDLTPPPAPVRPAAAVSTLDAAVAIESIQVKGALTPSAMARPIERMRSSFRSCYRKAAASAGRGEYGTVHLELRLDGMGRATRVRSSGQVLPGLGSCLEAAAKKIRSRVTPDIEGVRVLFAAKFVAPANNNQQK